MINSIKILFITFSTNKQKALLRNTELKMDYEVYSVEKEI